VRECFPGNSKKGTKEMREQIKARRHEIVAGAIILLFIYVTAINANAAMITPNTIRITDENAGEIQRATISRQSGTAGIRPLLVIRGVPSQYEENIIQSIESATNTILLTGIRPTTDVPPIEGQFTMEMQTAIGEKVELTVIVNLTTTYGTLPSPQPTQSPSPTQSPPLPTQPPPTHSPPPNPTPPPEPNLNGEDILEQLKILTEQQNGFYHWSLALAAMTVGLLVTIIIALIWRK